MSEIKKFPGQPGRTNNKDKTKEVNVYCLTRVRSDSAVQLLRQEGFTNVHDLKSGLTALKLTA